MCLAWKNRLYVKLFGEAARTGRVSAWVLVVGYIRIRFVVLLCTQSILISTALYKAEGKRERESSYRVALYEPDMETATELTVDQLRHFFHRL